MSFVLVGLEDAPPRLLAQSPSQMCLGHSALSVPLCWPGQTHCHAKGVPFEILIERLLMNSLNWLTGSWRCFLITENKDFNQYGSNYLPLSSGAVVCFQTLLTASGSGPGKLSPLSSQYNYCFLYYLAGVLICLPVINFPLWLSGSLINNMSRYTKLPFHLWPMLASQPFHPCGGAPVLIKWTGGMCIMSLESRHLNCSCPSSKMMVQLIELPLFQN